MAQPSRKGYLLKLAHHFFGKLPIGPGVGDGFPGMPKDFHGLAAPVEGALRVFDINLRSLK
jgi:hypothetical protein